MVLANSFNERSFFTFFAPLTCLDHIPIVLLMFGPTRYEISEKIRALACPLFEISNIKVYVHDVGFCIASSISQPFNNDFWDTLYIWQNHVLMCNDVFV